MSIESPNPRNPVYSVGVKWDKYQSNVESKLVQDLIDLQNYCEIQGSTLQVVCESNEADRALKSLGINRLSIESLPGLWLLYKTDRKSIIHYPIGKLKIQRNLFEVKSRSNILNKDSSNGIELQDQGRDSNYNPFDRPPPYTNGTVPLDPIVTLIFGNP